MNAEAFENMGNNQLYQKITFPLICQLFCLQVLFGPRLYPSIESTRHKFSDPRNLRISKLVKIRCRSLRNLIPFLLNFPNDPSDFSAKWGRQRVRSCKAPGKLCKAVTVIFTIPMSLSKRHLSYHKQPVIFDVKALGNSLKKACPETLFALVRNHLGDFRRFRDEIDRASQ